MPSFRHPGFATGSLRIQQRHPASCADPVNDSDDPADTASATGPGLTIIQTPCATFNPCGCLWNRPSGKPGAVLQFTASLARHPNGVRLRSFHLPHLTATMPLPGTGEQAGTTRTGAGSLP